VGCWAISKTTSGKAKTAEKKVQVLSAIHVMCLTLKKILAQAIVHPKIHAQPKCKKKIPHSR